MRFFMMIKSDAKSEAGVLPDAKFMAAMDAYNQELVKAGVMLGGEGLQPSSKGVRLRHSNGKTKLIDGPFAEAKQLLAGFWMIQAKSKAEAIEWAKRVPAPEDAGPDEYAEIELRTLYETEDFPVDAAEQPGGWRDQEQTLRDQVAAGQAAPARLPNTQRFIVMLKADKLTEAPATPNSETLERMGALMSESLERGMLLSGDGLKPSSEGVRVRIGKGKRSVIDGPFAETKELIAGYSIIQVPSRAEAVEWAKRWLVIHVEGVGVTETEFEVRPLYEMEDFAGR